MKDCKHKYFQRDCMVCWFKYGNGIHVEDAPIRGDEGTDKHRKDCINIASGIGKAKLKAWGIG